MSWDSRNSHPGWPKQTRICETIDTDGQRKRCSGGFYFSKSLSCQDAKRRLKKIDIRASFSYKKNLLCKNGVL